MHRSIAAIVLAGLGCALNSGAAVNNLVPNGDIENEFVNLVRYDKGYATHIEPRDTGVPAHWQLTGEGGLCRAEKQFAASRSRGQGGFRRCLDGLLAGKRPFNAVWVAAVARDSSTYIVSLQDVAGVERGRTDRCRYVGRN